MDNLSTLNIDSDTSVGFGSANNLEDLRKALTAGSSANPGAMGTSGNTLQFESLEGALLSALEQRPEDFKLMKMQFSNKVGSTVHQYTVNKDSGSYDGIFTAENGDPIESNSNFARRTRTLKYMQTKREVTMQASLLNPAIGGDPEATEERQGTHVLLKGAEWGCFHGNATVSPQMFDGYPQQIRNEASSNVFDMLGERISSSNGENIFLDAVRSIGEVGGEVSDVFYPYLVSQDFQNLVRDRIRFGIGDKAGATVINTYPTVFGDVRIAGKECGPDKMFKVKTIPTPSSATLTAKPNAPTFALAAQATTGGTGFLTGTAGTYRYTVYAINENGLISDAAVAANIAVAAGQEVKITITPGAAPAGSGYIVCRGKKDVTTGTDIREMFKIADSGAATTDALDQNDELPGTAEMLLLSNNLMQRTFQWDSLLDVMRFNLGPTKAHIPFLMIWYGTPDMKVAEYNGLIKNIGHPQTEGWF